MPRSLSRTTQNESLVQDAFWQQSLTAPDELRQRVKYALSQMFVISSNNTTAIQNMPRGEASYYDMLGADAFGNFRQLLQDVTLSPMMGQFLSMQGNDKGNATTDPDENYAREVMQLFTIGLWQLNDDGSQQLDGTGNPIPTYSNTDVKGLAAVFTGFSWNIPGDSTRQRMVELLRLRRARLRRRAAADAELPQPPLHRRKAISRRHHSRFRQPRSRRRPQNRSRHAVQPSQSACVLLQADDPAPGHEQSEPCIHQPRCARSSRTTAPAFAAICRLSSPRFCMDPEARDTATDTTQSAIRQGARGSAALHRVGARLHRAIAHRLIRHRQHGRSNLRPRRDVAPLAYGLQLVRPGYTPPNTSISTDGLLAPEMQMTNVSTVVGYINYMQNAIGANAQGGPDVFSSYATEMSLAATPDQLLDRINLLLMAGQMNSTLYNQILPPSAPSPSPPAIRTQSMPRFLAACKRPSISPWRRPTSPRSNRSQPCANAHQSRRQFLRTASMASMAGFYVSPFLLELNSLAAMAQGTSGSDYRALVCVYLQGGNDGHGTVIATDTDSFAAFTRLARARRASLIRMNELLPITLKTPQTGRTFALNPSLGGVQNLFNAGRAAIVANTGTLVTPATKTQINANSVPLPDSLFSHFDQTAAWQAIASNLGSGEHVGWGGAVADAIEAMNMNSNSMFTCISTAGNALFLAGQSSFQLNVTPAGPIPIYGLQQPPFGLPAAANPLNSILTTDETNLFAKEYEVVINRSMQAQATLATAMAPAGDGRRRQSSAVSRSHDQYARRQSAGRVPADRRAHHRRPSQPRRHAADLLRPARQLRYARRPGADSRPASHPARRGV